jgi:outer membrane lipoprotein-sorting protein
MKKIISILSMLILFTSGVLFAQTILTASDYFKSVSEFYGTINDYTADVTIVANKQEMEGFVSFKKPNLLRIDFTSPQDQVIVFTGENLTIYLPTHDSAMVQALEQNTDPSATGANLATPQGLYLLSRYYYVSYEIGQAPVPYEEGSDEMVIKLILSRKNLSEGFKTIKLAISADTKLIRSVEAVQAATDEVFLFEFDSYTINQGIPAERFVYDYPSSANSYYNFLFSE